MIKVFIVDDEMLIRMGIKMMTEWNKYGIDIVGEASNGEEAMDKIRTLDPDIVITDLVMPVIDGLSLIKELKRSRFSGKIIVLSNYNEFEMVKEAMKSGASEYLLKVTLDSNELIGLINTLSQDINNQKEDENVSAKLKTELNENKSAIKEKLLKTIRSETIAQSDIESKFQFYNLKVSPRNIIISAIIDDVDSALIQTRMKDESLLNLTVENLLDEVINKKYRGEIFFYKKGVFVILLDLKNSDRPTDTGTLVYELCGELRTLLKRYLCVESLYIYMNDFVDMDNLGRSINTVISAEEATLFPENEFVLECGRLNHPADRIDDAFWRLKSELKETIDVQPHLVEEVISKIFNHISEKQYQRILMKQIYRNLVMIFEEAVIRENGDLYKVIDREAILGTEISSSMASYKSRILDIAGNAMNLIHSLKKDRLRDDVLKAIHFIKTHYSEKISLEDISLHVNMNKNYFCKLFKDETGLSPVEYIIDYKIQKAKELLKSGKAKVSSVAKAIGYDDVSYFNRLFKRHVGSSPGNYIK